MLIEHSYTPRVGLVNESALMVGVARRVNTANVHVIHCKHSDVHYITYTGHVLRDGQGQRGLRAHRRLHIQPVGREGTRYISSMIYSCKVASYAACRTPR